MYAVKVILNRFYTTLCGLVKRLLLKECHCERDVNSYPTLCGLVTPALIRCEAPSERALVTGSDLFANASFDNDSRRLWIFAAPKPLTFCIKRKLAYHFFKEKRLDWRCGLLRAS